MLNALSLETALTRRSQLQAPRTEAKENNLSNLHQGNDHDKLNRMTIRDDAFEAEERGARVQERRRKAPVAKKVRIDASSSGAPPSHQPPPRANADDDYIPEQQEQEGSYSEDEAPDMTEEAPPSSYQIAAPFSATEQRYLKLRSYAKTSHRMVDPRRRSFYSLYGQIPMRNTRRSCSTIEMHPVLRCKIEHR